MNIVHFLTEEPTAYYLLGSVIRLPESYCSIGTKQPEQPGPAALRFVLFYGVYYFGCRIFLKITKHITEVMFARATCYQMQMIAHDHPGEDMQAFMLLTITKAIHDNIRIAGTNENINPLMYCTGQKIKALPAVYAVTVAHLLSL